jgi:hypothetical protein
LRGAATEHFSEHVLEAATGPGVGAGAAARQHLAQHVLKAPASRSHAGPGDVSGAPAADHSLDRPGNHYPRGDFRQSPYKAHFLFLPKVN